MNTVVNHVSRDTLLSWLGEVMDPEVPVVSIVDLGILRDVQWHESLDSTLIVTVTPTYSGCPATEVIAQSICKALHARGISKVEVSTQLSPAWTTDWMTAQGRDALRAYGIAPPAASAARADGSLVIDIAALTFNKVFSKTVVPCPQCDSRNTRLLSQYGSTACKALYQCNSCLEPFDYFKPH
ncbi:MAG: phenylacetate-CoA oxygenase subunit PaaJ [Vitreoscilla sp.]|nr:phenylacetate-CoA oxygenase subunit PaaJ [Polaromonas sp.]